MNNRSGTYVSNLTGEAFYKSFKPSFLPLDSEIIIDKDILFELIDANKRLASLDALSSHIPNIDLFLSMYIRKEAILSSQIEGTQCTLEDILDPAIENNNNLDVKEVLNYIKATEYAINRLNSLPLCNRLIKETHEVLLSNTRGHDKNPGEFRRSQNWIGGKGSTIKNARYIPPNVEDMNATIENLEEYINRNIDIDPLIKIALIHYQFETIHPFLDGNGRIGRLSIILLLIQNKILNLPVLYISYYLKINRIEYYDRMTQVRESGDYEQWIKFFLHALAESSSDAIDTINKLIELHNTNIQKIKNCLISRKQTNALKILEYLESSPIIDISKTAIKLNVSYNTIASGIKELQNIGILVQKDKIGKNRIFAYEEYLSILRKDI